jgi:general secretion pathway protein A
LRQFAQRVSAAYHLCGMDKETTVEYVRHRLRHVGGSGDEFTEKAIEMIHEQAEGIPRMVNKLADFGMVYATAADKNVVTEDDHQRSAEDDDIFLKPKILPGEAAE